MTNHPKLETKEVELTLPANLRTGGAERDTIRHRFADRELDAINAALLAGRPLLVRGEPGVGKSQLARAAAQGLGRVFVSKVIDARTEARDLLYTFDAVRRLADAQTLNARGITEAKAVEQALAELRYVQPGPLWWAFDWDGARRPTDGAENTPPEQSDEADPGNGAVVLLDELDKADSSVPNGLLEALGQGAFDGPGGLRVESRSTPPLVVVTTNEERALPDAFLRRCLVLHLKVPTKRPELLTWLEHRARGHFDQSQIANSILRQAAEQLADDRREILRRGLAPPGSAEFLDLLRVLVRATVDSESQQQLLDQVSEFVLRKYPDDPEG